MKSSSETTLVGAGLTGPLLAIYLARSGHKVRLLERRPDIRKEKIPAGRSINLAISERGLRALRNLGLEDKILAKAIPMVSRAIHDRHGKVTHQDYGRNPQEHINAISRALLNGLLLDELEKYPHVSVQFQQNAKACDFLNKGLLYVDERNGVEKELQFKTLISTEGSSSRLRKDFTSFLPEAQFTRMEEDHGYKELTIPPGPNGEHRLDKKALHIWPRSSYMLIALPNLDGSFTCTLFLAKTGELSFESLQSPEQVRAFFKNDFPDAFPLMEYLTEEFFTNPTGELVTIKGGPWHLPGEFLLMGDAAHGIVPFLGQGMNCCFEDVVVFDQLLQKNPHSPLGELFASFEQLRRPHTDALAQMAVDNFLEMRDHVADPKFLLKKQIEKELMLRYPERFYSQYHMITFQTVPYEFAQRCGKLQKTILNTLGHGARHLEDVDWDKAQTLLEDYFQKEQNLKQEYNLL